MAYPTDNPLDGRGGGRIDVFADLSRPEIARRCAAHGSMLKALRMARAAIRALHGPVAWEIYERASPEMRTIDAALTMGAEDARAAPPTPRVPTITTGGGEI